MLLRYRKVGHRKADCWSWEAAQNEKEMEKLAAQEDATPKKGEKKEGAGVDVGSLEVGPLSACASESWILSVEVTEIDERWIAHNEDEVMVDTRQRTRVVRSSEDQSNSHPVVLEATGLSTSARRRSATPQEMVATSRSGSKPRRCDGHCSRHTVWWRKDRWQCSRTLVASSSQGLHYKWIQL